jgi:hypothetical protein
MKIIITKKQYKNLVYSLIDSIVGGDLVLKTTKGFTYHNIYDSYGEVVMNIFFAKGSGKTRGCKNDLGLNSDFVMDLEKYVPYFKHKMFSKVLIDYVYDKTNIKCDCIDYSYGDEQDRFIYNLKKKKIVKLGESVDDRQSLDEIIYNFLKDEYYPDYNWGPELFDFYREDVEEYGSIAFYINDSEGYIYYDDGTLEVLPWVSERLDSWFNNAWQPVFKKWFEENSGLKVNRIVTDDHTTTLNESTNIDKNKKLITDIVGFDFSNNIQQITSTYDVPTSFDDGIAPSTIRTYLNHWGPMYLVKIDGENYLYQDRGDFEMFIDEDGYWNKDEIPEKLGIAILGLRFSDIIDMYFEE